MNARAVGRKRRVNGFSLVELLVSAALVAIGFIGIAGAMSYAAKVSRIAQDTMIAEDLAAGLLAKSRLAGYANLSSWHTYGGEKGISGFEQDFSTELANSRLALAQAWFTVTDVQKDLRGLSVVITWGTGSPGGKVETETLISPRF